MEASPRLPSAAQPRDLLVCPHLVTVHGWTLADNSSTDLTLVCSMDTFVKLATGQISGPGAVMSKKITLTGKRQV
jgi:putative sterol carrier protein